MPATRVSIGQESDDEDESSRRRHSISDSEHGEDERQTPSPPDNNGLNGSGDNTMEEGMLPRDMPTKTAFFDPVAERKMTQTDAKLFYQQSQLDLQKLGGGSSWGGNMESTPQGSPVMSAHGGQEKAAYGYESNSAAARSPQGSRFPELPLHAAREVGPYGTRADAIRTQGGITPVGNLAGVTATGLAEPAARAQMLSLAEPAGIGNSTYADADPEITSELNIIFTKIQKVLDLRHKYIRMSLQGEMDNPKDETTWDIYTPPPEPAWAEEHEKAANNEI